MQAVPARARLVPGVNPIWGLVAAAWALGVVMVATGSHQALRHHDVLADTTIPSPASLALFLAAWQVMTAGMMLPSSLPMVHLFARASRGQTRPRLALGLFLAAYFAVWTLFALAALLTDAGLHALVARWGWLDARPWLISGMLLVAAGAFQFSPLKERCLDACRNPLSFLWHHYRRGPRAAWDLGWRHGLFCLGCCWALMLVMFAVGVGSLVWMAGLTGVMVIEKTSRAGRRLVSLVGAALLLWGALLLLAPAALPAALGGI
jgi:predicted metal-binding membrane protein